jgi:hypothetical protein
LKAELQREFRRAHSKYMEDVVSVDLKENPEQFWPYVKTRKHETSQAVTLTSKDGYHHSEAANKISLLNQQFPKRI